MKEVDCDKFWKDAFICITCLICRKLVESGMRKLVEGDMRKLVESDMRSARMRKVTKVICEKKEQGTTAIKGNTDFWKAVRVIFTCFTRFSGSKVLEVDLSACTFLQCQSGGKETRCRLEPRSAELGYGKIIAQTTFIHVLCRAGRIKMVQVTQGKINSGSQVPGEHSLLPPSQLWVAAWRQPEQQRCGLAGTWLLPMAELGVGLWAGPWLWLPQQARWVRGIKMTQKWVEWLICQMFVPPFGRIWTGWRNGLTGTL